MTGISAAGELLDAVDENAPVVLVGHSWGGPIIRLFAHQHPERTAALVFVDSSLAESMSPRNARLTRWSFRISSVLARLGGTRLLERVALPHGASDEISESDVAIMIRDYASAQTMRAGSREAAQIVAAIPTMRRLQIAGTPGVPTVCVQGGRVDPGMKTLRPLLNKTTEELMAATARGKVIVVERAGHLIPQECPGPVRDAIFGVLDDVADEEPPCT